MNWPSVLIQAFQNLIGPLLVDLMLMHNSLKLGLQLNGPLDLFLDPQRRKTGHASLGVCCSSLLPNH